MRTLISMGTMSSRYRCLGTEEEEASTLLEEEETRCLYSGEEQLSALKSTMVVVGIRTAWRNDPMTSIQTISISVLALILMCLASR